MRSHIGRAYINEPSQTPKPKLLLLGASSFVGQRLYHRVGFESAVGTCFRNLHPGMRYFNSVAMNLDSIIEESDNFSHAVILLGDTQPDSCVSDEVTSELINVNSIVRIIDCLIAREIIPVFISSQFVFDGVQGNYEEEDAVNPILVYGRQKVCVEQYLISHCEEYLILRLGNVYGDTQSDGTLFTAWMDSLVDGVRHIRCASDQTFSAVYVEDVVTSILATVGNNCTGIYHVGARTAHTRIELLAILLSELNKLTNIDVEIEPCSINDFDLPEMRPIDVSMNPDKLIRDTGVDLHEVGECCERIARKYVLQNELAVSGP
ncbi:MAG: hypothetical protein CL471_09180 [Acidobacteria bacterium]|nr:hypothetical protein [Acidobacteriota bacterium]